LYLLPEAQGRGIGTRVLSAAAHRLVDERLTPIRTTVFEDNLRARRLYERLGGQCLGRRIVFEDAGRPIWDCVYGWPDPAPLLAAFAPLGAPHFYVGDSEVDAETARAAGVRFALHTEGYRKAPPSELAHAFAFDDFARLVPLMAAAGQPPVS
ncbi:MAG: GNAT family N-acetyltransferase, partial [Pararhodobacter sp.]|nr:GNAT family N-acetyltransferase [Pararhodobacter sp.]